RNLFTLFGDRYPVRAYEPVTHLCPVERCGAEPSQPLRQALSDAWVVYRHRVLPEALREGLPPIDQGWGNFGGGVGGGDGVPPCLRATSRGRRPPRAGPIRWRAWTRCPVTTPGASARPPRCAVRSPPSGRSRRSR